jgi:hypothetical protein
MTRLAIQTLSQMSIEVRQRRAQLKAEVKSGEVKISEPLTEPTTLLAAVRQQSFKSACALLAELRIPELKPLGKMTYRQRRVIADHVAAKWEREPKPKGKSGRTVRPHSFGPFSKGPQ